MQPPQPGFSEIGGSSRFEEMRTFRKCITEFVLDPGHEPAGFQPWLWRYPVRIDIAIEGGVSPETVHTQLGRVLAKTGCKRQADVVALLTGIALPRTTGPL